MKMEKKERELDDLLNKYLDGNLSEVDALSLKYSNRGICRGKRTLLGIGVDPWNGRTNDAECLSSSNYWQRVRRARKKTKNFGLSRIKTGIAGLAIGVFSASVVWAFNLPQDNQPQPKIQEIVSESFEESDRVSKAGFPRKRVNGLGIYLRFQQAKRYLPQVECELLQFLDNSKAKFAYARYLIDLDEYAKPGQNHSRSVRVEASFFASNPDESSVFQIRLAAFQSGTPRGSTHLE